MKVASQSTGGLQENLAHVELRYCVVCRNEEGLFLLVALEVWDKNVRELTQTDLEVCTFLADLLCRRAQAGL